MMSLRREKGRYRLIEGDCLAVLPTMPSDSVHCVVTSPPYFALRSYLAVDDPLKAEEIGSEPTPEAFIQTMVAVFREVRRVLHPTGLLFLNLGDSYSGGGGFSPNSPSNLAGSIQSKSGGAIKGRIHTEHDGQLLNIPHRVAEALRADGWIWRQTIVWSKPSPMPESCKGWRWQRCRVKVGEDDQTYEIGGVVHWNKGGKNLRGSQWASCPGCPKCEPHGGYVLRRGKGRCTTAHEYIFVFAKSDRYFWDSAAFVEKVSGPQTFRPFGKAGNADRHDQDRSFADASSRNPRSVWAISNEPTSEKHFAAYPSELVRRCLQAGTSDGGCCPKCLMPWAPVVDEKRQIDLHSYTGRAAVGCRDRRDADTPRMLLKATILGYRPTCKCNQPVGRKPCIVLDPFAGTGTTLQTAVYMGRNAIGIELNPEYIAIARKKIRQPPVYLVRKHDLKRAGGHNRDRVGFGIEGVDTIKEIE